MSPDDLTLNSRTPQIVRAIHAIWRRLTVLENVIMGEPTPQQIAEGQQLGLIGMMRKAENDRRKMKVTMYAVLVLLFLKALIDSPTSIPLFVKTVEHILK